MSEASLWYLKNLTLFRDLSDETMQELNRITEMCDYPTGQRIPTDEHRGSVGFIKKGQIKVIRSDAEGRKITRALLGPGELLGTLSESGPAEAHRAESVETSLVCWASRKKLIDFIQNQPKLGLRVSRQLQEQLERIDFRLENLLFKNAPDRIEFVLGQLAGANRDDQPALAITLRMSHQDLADLSGLTRSTVTRHLNKLADDDLLTLKRGAIQINKPERFIGAYTRD